MTTDLLLLAGALLLLATPIAAWRAWPTRWAVGDATFPQRARNVFVGTWLALAAACGLLALAAAHAASAGRGGLVAALARASLQPWSIGLAVAGLGALALATLGWWRGRAWFSTPPLASGPRPGNDPA